MGFFPVPVGSVSAVGLRLLAQCPQLIFDLEAQLPEAFNIDPVFAGTPVLRIGDTNLQFVQAGAIRLHGKLHGRMYFIVAVSAST